MKYIYEVCIKAYDKEVMQKERLHNPLERHIMMNKSIILQ